MRLSCSGPIFEGYGARIAKDQFDITKETPGFAAKLAMKDVRHIRNLAKDSKARSCRDGLFGLAHETSAAETLALNPYLNQVPTRTPHLPFSMSQA